MGRHENCRNGPLVVIYLLLITVVCVECKLSSFASFNINLQWKEKSDHSQVNRWQENHKTEVWRASETAIIVVDMWNKHWCPSATERIAGIGAGINITLNAARNLGITIIHAPSDCMGYYANYSQRKRVLSLPFADLPLNKQREIPPLPLDNSDGGCDVSGISPNRVWTKETDFITIHPSDLISAGPDGDQTPQELWNIVSYLNLKNLLYVGVHENMCILNRPFALETTIDWNLNLAICRDLVDVMYNPYMSPYVSHEDGLQLHTDYIEKFWVPTFSMFDLLQPTSAISS